jgi:hypothetical protein
MKGIPKLDTYVFILGDWGLWRLTPLSTILRWFSPGTPVFFTNKTDRHDINEILLKVTFNTITLTLKQLGTKKLFKSPD